jgi:gamma-glutamylcyclotransferase (GGCT)/AIG2-like uncharacterized protein YtfP
MTQHLFVYGTLAPGQPNNHVLEDIGGTWERATVKGKLKKLGWGANLGYPGIVLEENGKEVEGFLFSSDNLDKHWNELDEFEGDEYKRVCNQVQTKDGKSIMAYIYVIRNN